MGTPVRMWPLAHPSLLALACLLRCLGGSAATSDTASSAEDAVCPAGAAGCGDAGLAQQRPYYWSGKNGDANRTGASLYEVTFNTSKGLSWKWTEEIDVLRAPPLIDDELNIYQTTGPGTIIKFSPDGRIMWKYRHHGGMNTVGAIMDGMLFGAAQNGFVFAINMKDGSLRWRVPISAIGTFGDSHVILATNGTIVTNTRVEVGDLNQQVVALNAVDGSVKWKFLPDWKTFNFMASAPGDGTVVFSDHPGTLYRVWLHDGSLLWKSVYEQRDVDLRTFTTGSCIIGPNNMVYVVANTHTGGYQGVVRAHHLHDGSLAWYQFTGQLQGNQAPAVGRLGRGEPLSLVAVLGENPGSPAVFNGLGFLEYIIPKLPELLQLGIRIAHHTLAIQTGARPTWLWKNTVHFPGSVIAFDATTGHMRWRYDPEPWRLPACAGDSERLFPRFSAKKSDPAVEETCLPDSWASPAIGGDGTVFAGFMDGRMYAIRDQNKDGIINVREDVTSYDTGDGFLGGSAIAPGLLAFTPCGGGMYVFRQ